MNIVISGDLLPTPNNEKLFNEGDVETLVGKEIIDIYRNADFRISNMEGPLTDSDVPIEKSGPNIKGSSGSIKGIKALGIDCVSIANNHILDYGEKGFDDTLRVLGENSIDYVGAGRNLSEAAKPYITQICGVKVGIYSCAEYEFTIATESRGGANPFDALEIADEIRKLKKQCDVVIVLYHGGKELYRYPVPYVQKRCRKMADAGADFILCQHSHCIGCYEIYQGATILYGQGNFILCRADDEYRHTGLLVSIKVENGVKSVEFIPVVRHGERVRLAEENEKQEILGDFNNRSKEIINSEFVKQRYKEFAVSIMEPYYLNSLGVFGSVLRRLKIKNKSHKFFKRGSNLFILNTLRCEAHRDIMREGIESLLWENNKGR